MGAEITADTTEAINAVVKEIMNWAGDLRMASITIENQTKYPLELLTYHIGEGGPVDPTAGIPSSIPVDHAGEIGIEAPYGKGPEIMLAYYASGQKPNSPFIPIFLMYVGNPVNGDSTVWCETLELPNSILNMSGGSLSKFQKVMFNLGNDASKTQNARSVVPDFEMELSGSGPSGVAYTVECTIKST